MDRTELISRLKKARCWHTSDSYGYHASKWFHLREFDLHMAIHLLEQDGAKGQEPDDDLISRSTSPGSYDQPRAQGREAGPGDGS